MRVWIGPAGLDRPPPGCFPCFLQLTYFGPNLTHKSRYDTKNPKKIFFMHLHDPGSPMENLEDPCRACCSCAVTQGTTTTPLHVWEGTMCSHFPIAGAQQLPCPNMYASTARVYSKQPLGAVTTHKLL